MTPQVAGSIKFDVCVNKYHICPFEKYGQECIWGENDEYFGKTGEIYCERLCNKRPYCTSFEVQRTTKECWLAKIEDPINKKTP